MEKLEEDLNNGERKVELWANSVGVKIINMEFKTVKMFEMCAWTGPAACEVTNRYVFDESMYLGRIQINLNRGDKRKYLYFQAKYKPKQ